MMEEFLSSHLKFAPSREKAWAEDLTEAQMETIEHLLAGNTIDDSQLASVGVEKTIVELPLNATKLDLRGSKNAELLQKVISELDPSNNADKEIIFLQRNAGFHPIGLESGENTPHTQRSTETNETDEEYYLNYDSEEEPM